MSDNKDNCVICLEPVPDEAGFYLLQMDGTSCMHRYHGQCIAEYILRFEIRDEDGNLRRMHCPVCRRNFRGFTSIKAGPVYHVNTTMLIRKFRIALIGSHNGWGVSLPNDPNGGFIDWQPEGEINSADNGMQQLIEELNRFVLEQTDEIDSQDSNVSEERWIELFVDRNVARILLLILAIPPSKFRLFRRLLRIPYTLLQQMVSNVLRSNEDGYNNSSSSVTSQAVQSVSDLAEESNQQPLSHSHQSQAVGSRVTPLPRSFPCHCCNLRFFSRIGRFHHICTHHEFTCHICRHCVSWFITSDALRTHISRCHQQSMQSEN